MADVNRDYLEKESANPRQLLSTLVMQFPYVVTESSHKLHYLRYDGDKMSIRLAYDTTPTFVSNGNCHSEDTITICSRRADTIRWRHSMLCFLSLVLKDIARDVRSVAQKAKNRGIYSVVLGYARMSETALLTEWLESCWFCTKGQHWSSVQRHRAKN
jgi:hypothetical protein